MNFFCPETRINIDFLKKDKKKCQKNVRNYCGLKIKQYICKVNKAQNKKQNDMNSTIKLQEAATILMNGFQFILTGEYILMGEMNGQKVVMDSLTNQIYILS